MTFIKENWLLVLLALGLLAWQAGLLQPFLSLNGNGAGGQGVTAPPVNPQPGRNTNGAPPKNEKKTMGKNPTPPPVPMTSQVKDTASKKVQDEKKRVIHRFGKGGGGGTMKFRITDTQ